MRHVEGVHGNRHDWPAVASGRPRAGRLTGRFFPVGAEVVCPAGPSTAACITKADIAGRRGFENASTSGRQAVPVVGSGRELPACHPITWPRRAHMIEPWHMPVAKTAGQITRNMRLVTNRNPYLIVGGVRPSPQQGGKVVAMNPTVRQRELGRRLREQRLEHGLTVEEVADKLLCSATKISRLETGTRRPSLRDVRDLCGVYNVDGETTDEFMELARGARQQAWWTPYEDLKLDPYLGLEEVATAITSFTVFYLPALLQTEDYTREVIKKVAPKMDPDICRQRVEARMRRQEVLEKKDRPRYRVLWDESVLRRPVGGSALMAAQIKKILQAEREGKASIQIIPFEYGVLAAEDSNFVLLEFDDTTLISPTVFVEGLTRNQYLEHSADVVRYREAIDYLRDSGLNTRDSVDHMTEMLKRYGGH